MASTNNPNDKNREVRSNNTGYLQFPDDVEKSIGFHAYKMSKAKTESTEKKDGAVVSMYLPLPADLGQSLGLEYNEEELGLTGNLTFQQGNLGDILYKGGLAVTDEVRALTEGGRETTINPYTVSQFQKVSHGSYTFSWILIPRSENEAINIQKIVNKFRYHALPDGVVTDSTFGVPEVWRMDFMPNALNKVLFEARPLGLTNVQVQYNSATAPKFFGNSENPYPVETVLTLTFTELTIHTKKTFEAWTGSNI